MLSCQWLQGVYSTISATALTADRRPLAGPGMGVVGALGSGLRLELRVAKLARERTDGAKDGNLCIREFVQLINGFYRTESPRAVCLVSYYRTEPG